jgi:hypothetical protein
MSSYSTFGSFIGLGKETTYGTAVAASSFLELMEGGDGLTFKGGQIAKPTLRTASTMRTVKAKKSVEGTLKFPFSFGSAESILRYGLGSVVTSPLSGSNKSHAFSLINSLPNTGLTFRVNRGEASSLLTAESIYSGCKINKIGFSLQPEGQLECSVDILGQDEAFGAASTPTYTTTPYITWDLLTTKTIAGTDVAIQSLELNIENNLDADTYKLGSLLRQEMGRSANRKISGSFELEFTSVAHYNYFKNYTANAIVLEFDGGVITGADHYLLNISMPNVIWQGDTPVADKVGPFKQKLNFETVATSENNDLTITLQNATASVA